MSYLQHELHEVAMRTFHGASESFQAHTWRNKVVHTQLPNTRKTSKEQFTTMLSVVQTGL